MRPCLQHPRSDSALTYGGGSDLVLVARDHQTVWVGRPAHLGSSRASRHAGLALSSWLSMRWWFDTFLHERCDMIVSPGWEGGLHCWALSDRDGSQLNRRNNVYANILISKIMK